MGTQLDSHTARTWPGAPAGQPPLLHGRAAEQAIIDRLIATARAGSSGALVVRGEAGIGKTALLDYAASAAAAVPPPPAPAVLVIRALGSEAESGLPFAGLHLLLRPVLDRLPALPRPQQDALRGALGLGSAVAQDRFLTGLALLSLLTELADERPLLCLVDDVHWLDRDSADALMFAARRLHAEGVAIIFAARGPARLFAASGLPELPLRGLDEAAASALLMEHGGAALAPGIRRRILAEASGNALGLIELPAAYLAGPAAAPWLDGPPPPLTDRLQRAFYGPVQRLPRLTQSLLLVAAAESSGDLPVVLDAARVSGATAADLEPAEQAGLVHTAGGTLQFRHPLVRAAVLSGAPLTQLAAAHRALAGALRNPADADRRAWHLAAAATGPDEAAAAELERTAATATARGGYAAAAAAYERAVQLTADPAAQTGRLALAAEAAAEIGDFGRARALGARAAGQDADPVTRARLAAVRARADFGQGRVEAALRLQVDGAAQIAGQDPLRAARMLMYAVHIAWFAGDPALISDTASRLESAARAVPEPAVPLVRLVLCAAAQATGEPAAGVGSLAGLVAQARNALDDDPFALTMVAAVSLVIGLNTKARDILAALAGDARAQGKIGWLPTILTCLAPRPWSSTGACVTG